jgi:protein-disulfide isomerase
VSIVPKALRFTGKFAAVALVATMAVAAARPGWTTYVVQTEGGGHRLGNPAAKVAVMEFVSYTCPHCAHFQQESDGAMRLAYVAPGTVSVEVRPVIRNPIDLAATLLAECGPKEKFFANHSAILLSQATWLGKVSSVSEATQVRWRSGPVAQRMRAIAGDTGLYEIMAKRGYDRVTADKCLSNEAEARRIVDQSNAGSDAFGVTGTPSFALDGALLEGTHTWDTLQPQIAARLK